MSERSEVSMKRIVMKKYRLLDLFCKAGGAGMGYHRAGFDVVGVDHEPQPRYPFTFVEADALEFVGEFGHEFDVVHASPPCQGYSRVKTMHTTRHKTYPMIVETVRKSLRDSGLPYVIENVVGCPLIDAITLCGLMFGLKVFRHRLFESNIDLRCQAHLPHGKRRIGVGGFVCCAGHGDSGRDRIPADHRNKASWEKAMKIDWMTRDELSQAIPPAYTEFIGKQLMQHIRQ